MKEVKNKLTELDTYVFVDVSNIRAACVRTLGFNIDFYKFLDYLQRKYPKLKNVYYYEGIARGDGEKQAEFDKLKDAGYDIRSLERKAYTEPPVYREIKCRNCKTKRRVQVLKKVTKLKSNVDVYLATDLLRLAYLTQKKVHIILVSCDGDYAEMIKSAIDINPRVIVSVLGTPVARGNRNTLHSQRDFRQCVEKFRIFISGISKTFSPLSQNKNENGSEVAFSKVGAVPPKRLRPLM